MTDSTEEVCGLALASRLREQLLLVGMFRSPSAEHFSVTGNSITCRLGNEVDARYTLADEDFEPVRRAVDDLRIVLTRAAADRVNRARVRLAAFWSADPKFSGLELPLQEEIPGPAQSAADDARARIRLLAQARQCTVEDIAVEAALKLSAIAGILEVAEARRVAVEAASLPLEISSEELEKIYRLATWVAGE